MEIISDNITKPMNYAYEIMINNPAIISSMAISALILGGIGTIGGITMGTMIDSPYGLGIMIGTTGTVIGAIIGIPIGLAGSCIYNHSDEIYDFFI